jgi:2-polyprenyl-3-methyl-5-hydroxy-6-metoxy-1,4-benzoquinol methylase
MIQQFDGVIMSHVLEHVAKPMELLLQIQKAAPGGVIMFVQSNWRGLMPRVYKSNWYAWAPTQHYWHFTPKGLTFIIQKLGWKTQKVEYSGLEHGTRLISRIGILFNSLADQFHLLARISGNHS